MPHPPKILCIWLIETVGKFQSTMFPVSTYNPTPSFNVGKQALLSFPTSQDPAPIIVTHGNLRLELETGRGKVLYPFLGFGPGN
ncbi:hypothetical protein PISMIDRAFT_681385, partial [Pisolithus microcarpus 441]